MDRTTYMPPTDDDSIDDAPDGGELDLLSQADDILTASARTVSASAMFAHGAAHCAPPGVADIPGVGEWLAKIMHSIYMTGRASGCAQLLGTDVQTLMRNIAKHLPNSYSARVVREAGWAQPRDTAERLNALNPAQRAMLDALAGGSAADALKATEMPAPEAGPGEPEPENDADACFQTVERVIALYPTAKISLEGMPAGVETRLRAKYPADKFIALTPEMIRAMNEAKGATRN